MENVVKWMLCIITWTFAHAVAAQSPSETRVAGAMRNVMQKGDLTSHISTDTISPKSGLYGLGPGANLKGELMILDGVVYQSTVVSPSTMRVEKKNGAKAPFFVYKHVRAWREVKLPDHVKTPKQLEKFLDSINTSLKNPFAFRIIGTPHTVGFHVVNLPKSAVIKSPADAHKGQINFVLHSKPVEILGFFSREHAGVFNHHDSFVHMHVITKSRKMLGHVDDFVLDKKQTRLYIGNQ